MSEDKPDTAVPPTFWDLYGSLPRWRRRVAVVTTVYMAAINLILGIGQLPGGWLLNLGIRYLLPLAVIAGCLGSAGVRLVPGVWRRINAAEREKARRRSSGPPWPYGRSEQRSTGSDDQALR